MALELDLRVLNMLYVFINYIVCNKNQCITIYRSYLFFIAEPKSNSLPLMIGGAVGGVSAAAIVVVVIVVVVFRRKMDSRKGKHRTL